MRVLIFSAAIVLGCTAAAAAKETRFWNLTANTVTHLYLSEPGKNAWGADQAKNDKDAEVDHDERVKVVGYKTGVYDVKIADAKRTCIVRNVSITEGKVFSIDEKAMTDCK